MDRIDIGRRQLLKASGLLPLLATSRKAFSAEKHENVEEVSPPEDLMREHGVLRRVLLIYRHVLTNLHDQQRTPWVRISDSAEIIRSYIENHHERSEEEHVFPAMRRAGKLVDLVETLLHQHRKGRILTDRITAIAKRQAHEDRKSLFLALSQFVRMYEPHAAREDTVLFPQLHLVWTGKEFEKMSYVFDEEEDRLFGEKAFENMVDRVAAIEKELGIHNLREFTPKN